MLNVATFASAFIILFVELYQIIKVLGRDQVQIGDHFDLFLFKGFVFIILGLGFLISGILTIRTLKQLYKEFYKDNKCALTVATMCLSLPLITRGIVSIAVSSNENFREFAYFNEITFDSLFYVIGTIIPVCC